MTNIFKKILKPIKVANVICLWFLCSSVVYPESDSTVFNKGFNAYKSNKYSLKLNKKSKSVSNKFSGYEIRVIYPKFILKRYKLELGGQATLIMNQTFIYSILLSGIIDFHLSEMFAIELGGSFGVSLDKGDKSILQNTFSIETQILRTTYIVNGGLLWTPIYGKTQLPSGRLVYFDTFLIFAGGLTGINYDYKHCETNDNPDEAPVAVTKSYPTGIVGIGQKFFLDRKTNLRWDVRENLVSYNGNDGACIEEDRKEMDSKFHHNATFSIGISTFF